MSENFLFADEPAEHGSAEAPEPFHVLIVDDDEEIHVITKMALSEFRLDGRPLSFTSAYSAAEAKEFLETRSDFALMLLDVVMESDHAGLDLARWTRDVLDNRLIRIVLRTGQPGQAPEEEVIARYDIDDYKEKTELTYRKLVTLMYSSLRAFRDLQAIEAYKSGLENIIRASAELFTASSVQRLAEAILLQLTALMSRSQRAAYCRLEGFTVSRTPDAKVSVIAATGDLADDAGQLLKHPRHQYQLEQLRAANEKVSFRVIDNTYYGLYKTASGYEYFLFIRGIADLDDTDQDLLSLFMNNTAIAFEHAQLMQQKES